MALYNTYRPQLFSELIGQEAAVEGLTNIVQKGDIRRTGGTKGRTYLFSGPRGCGKTSAARIFAKAINCENIQGYEPCNECQTCQEITEGISFSVEEIDAASSNGVDHVRELSKTLDMSIESNKKVYILDESHMLTEQASNAFLKNLEEPPAHVVFILVTTDPHKLKRTVLSRCIPFYFTLVPSQIMEGHVRKIIENEGLEVSDTALMQAISKGGGSVRDTLSALEALSLSGDIFNSHSYKLVESLAKKDMNEVFSTIALTAQEGNSMRSFAEETLSILRDVFLIQMKSGDLVISPDWGNRQAVADYMGAKNTVKAIEFIGEAISAMSAGYDERVNLEVNLARFCAMP